MKITKKEFLEIFRKKSFAFITELKDTSAEKAGCYVENVLYPGLSSLNLTDRFVTAQSVSDRVVRFSDGRRMEVFSDTYSFIRFHSFCTGKVLALQRIPKMNDGSVNEAKSRWSVFLVN